MNPRRRVVPNHPNVYFKPQSEADTPHAPYEVSYYDSNGKRTFKGGFTSIEAAELRLAEVKTDIGRGVPVVNSKVTFRQYAEKELAMRTKLKPQTVTHYEQLLRDHAYPLFGDRKLTDITRGHMRKMVGAELSPNTVKGLTSIVGSIFKSAVADGIIGVNPVDRLLRNERPRGAARAIRPFQPEEIEKVLKQAKDLRPLFETAMFAGLRAGELMGLTWKRVDLDEGVIHVREQFVESTLTTAPPKTAAGVRDVYIDAALVKTLKAHWLASPHKGPDDYVFCRPDGQPQCHSNMRYRFKTACRRAGLAERGLHQMRHTFATGLIASGLSPTVVQKQMGHESVKTTLDTYTHAWDKLDDPDRCREALAKMRVATG